MTTPLLHIERRLEDHPPPTPLSTPCRLWQGAVTRNYGRRRDHGLMHRWVWEQINGPIPAGMYVLHRCDQPLCYRLDHLFLGTRGDNNRDTVAKGRHWNQIKTHCKQGHPYDDENTYLRPDGRRACRTCRAN